MLNRTSTHSCALLVLQFIGSRLLDRMASPTPRPAIDSGLVFRNGMFSCKEQTVKDCSIYGLFCAKTSSKERYYFALEGAPGYGKLPRSKPKQHSELIPAVPRSKGMTDAIVSIHADDAVPPLSTARHVIVRLDEARCQRVHCRPQVSTKTGSTNSRSC